MGQRFLVILALLLMVRPIALAENLACGEEVTDPAPIPNKEIPCSDIIQIPEIVESSHQCPCFAFMQPEVAGIVTDMHHFSLHSLTIFAAKTAVATPPTPPPRLV